MSTSMFASNPSLGLLNLPRVSLMSCPSGSRIQKKPTDPPPFALSIVVRLYSTSQRERKKVSFTRQNKHQSSERAAMSVKKLNKIVGLAPEKETLEEHQGPAKSLEGTIDVVVSIIHAPPPPSAHVWGQPKNWGKKRLRSPPPRFRRASKTNSERWSTTSSRARARKRSPSGSWRNRS